jgi:hypothetical protein
MEKEEDGHLPFLNIDIYRKPEASLGHRFYRKPTYTNLYLQHNSHHHPSHKLSMLTSIIHRATAICDPTPSTKNWNSLPPCSRTMDTAPNRYAQPWNRQQRLPRQRTNRPQRHTYHTRKQPKEESAECWPNIILKVSQ